MGWPDGSQKSPDVPSARGGKRDESSTGRSVFNSNPAPFPDGDEKIRKWETNV